MRRAAATTRACKSIFAMPASNGLRWSTRSSSRHSGPTLLAWRSLVNDRRQRFAGVKHVAVAHVIGNVERRDEAELVGKHQSKRDRAACGGGDDERDERAGEDRNDAAEE